MPPRRTRLGATGRVGVEPAGQPGTAALELRGSILIYHRRSWLASSSVFIPVEWVRAERHRRFDVRRLYHGVISLLIAILFFLPLLVIVELFPPLQPLDIVLAVVFAGATIAACVFGCVSIARYFKPRTMTRLALQGQPYRMSIDFWHEPGREPRLDALVRQIDRIEIDETEMVPYPVRMNHIWRRPRPYRIALFKGLAISGVLYGVLLGLDLLALDGAIAQFPRFVYAIVLLPPLVNAAMIFLQRTVTAADPPAFRRAVRAYQAGDLPRAERELDSVLAAMPDFSAATLLMVQVCAEQYLFDKAFRYCDRLASEHPVLAQRLQGSLWEIKRIHSRMQP